MIFVAPGPLMDILAPFPLAVKTYSPLASITLAISIGPYYRINSSAPIQPPPTLMTSLPLITLAIILLVPNKYFPGPVLTTLSVQLFFCKWNYISSSTGSPFTTLYLGTFIIGVATTNFNLSTSHLSFRPYKSLLRASRSYSTSMIRFLYSKLTESILYIDF